MRDKSVEEHVKRIMDVGLLSEKDIREIKETSADFMKVYDSIAYDDTIHKLHDGPDLEDKEIARLCVTLCNRWRCRIREEAKKELDLAIPRARGLVDGIDEVLEDIKPSDYGDIIAPFRALTEIDNVGQTSASKILSLLKPDLYVMTDAAISWELGFATNDSGYFRYMLAMKEVAVRLRDIYKGSKKISFPGSHSLEQHLKPPERTWDAPLAIYLDEWNWMKITYELQQLEKEKKKAQ